MAQIIKFPAPASKFGYKRARKHARAADPPNQLQLFPAPRAAILSFSPAGSAFEQALALDERDEDRAAELYQLAIAEQDCVADAHCNLGIIHSRQGRMAKAIDSFTLALQHQPRHLEAHFNLGNIYFDLKEYRLAQVHYQVATELDPSFPNAYFNLALVLAINHDLASAVTALTTYQELAPIPEGRKADELLQSLKKTLTLPKNSESGSH